MELESIARLQTEEQVAARQQLGKHASASAGIRRLAKLAKSKQETMVLWMNGYMVVVL